MAKLIFLGEKFAGRVYEFAIERTTVGRGDHNTLTIQDSSVSHSHCEILVYGTEVIVRDLGSSNGTVVDGKRLHKDQQHPLDNGQVVRFGSVEARLDLAVDAGSDTVTGWTAVHSHARHLGDKPKPATSVTDKLEGPPVKDDHTVLAHARPDVSESKSATELVDTKLNPGWSSNASLLLIAMTIGTVLLIVCWCLLRYG